MNYMAKNNVLKSKSFMFSVRIVKLAEYLKAKHKSYELAQQVFRSGTAIGALIRESEYAESNRDFIHKLHIALKESNETEYWLDLAHSTSLISEKMHESFVMENRELLRMLISSIKTTKAHLAR
jgi:four helix bundle protein